MIDEIQVKNLALIEQASLEPARGLTVLTGETGAGKTALLNAMKLLMGERSDKLAVRDGCDELRVSGRFYFGENGEEVIVSRRVTADGKSKISLDGDMATAGELQEKIASHIDLCGQCENQQLTRVATHVGLLDAWVGAEAQKAAHVYKEAWAATNACAAEVARIEEAQAAGSARVEEARFVLSRIDAVNPALDEYEELLGNLARAEHAEALAVAANTAYGALQDEGGAVDKIGSAIGALEGVLSYDTSLSALYSQLHEASSLLEEVSFEARQYRDKVDYDPQTLEHQHERLAAYQGLMRSYGPRLEDVLAQRESAAQTVAMIDDAEDVLNQAKAALEKAEATLQTAAQHLQDVRVKAAPLFAAAVGEYMQRLEMGSAQIECVVESLAREQWSVTGPHTVEFMFKPGATMSPRPLAKIASGGEISRVMLAIKAVLGNHDDVDTLIFDEVDAGVGGSTAHALAGVIAELSQTHQVIVVTHLAQVAVHADVHYVVSKTVGDSPHTVLRQIESEAREAEIARMLSGDITPTSLAHAAELLQNARR